MSHACLEGTQNLGDNLMTNIVLSRVSKALPRISETMPAIDVAEGRLVSLSNS